jgi:uncharacterized membrane protein YkvA (DUF1232 family)
MKAPVALKMPRGRVWRELYMLYLAIRHPGTPWYVKLLPAAALAYAVSPVDLIPDVVPILGAVDDVVMLPTLILLAMRLVPDAVRQDCLARVGGGSVAGSVVSTVTGTRAARTAGIIALFVALALVAIVIAVVTRALLN